MTKHETDPLPTHYDEVAPGKRWHKSCTKTRPEVSLYLFYSKTKKPS